MQADLVVRGRRVITPVGERPAAVVVREGGIVAVAGFDEPLDAAVVVDAGDAVVLPGLVDSHVHVNEPGRTEWEGFATATRAAAAGGVTAIVDMPLNSVPPTTDVAGLRAKRSAAAGRTWVDVGFWGGIVPANTGDLEALADAGVFGFKAFLVDSGVEEFGCVDPGRLARAMEVLAAHDALAVVHAESPGPIAAAAASLEGRDPCRYATYLASRPDQAEVEAVQTVVELAARHSMRVHVLHLSSADSLAVLAEARAAGVAVSAETCPHYLALAAEDVPDAATEFKCAPPIRGRANADRLWDALAAGTVGMVVSDHSPCPPGMKRPDTGDFMDAWGGIASLQLGLSVIWTQARQRGFALADVVRWMSAGPAALVGLTRKGAIAPGRDADLVLFDPDAEWRVDPGALQHRHPITPYAGMALRGRVTATYLRGERVCADGVPTDEPAGRLLRLSR